MDRSRLEEHLAALELELTDFRPLDQKRQERMQLLATEIGAVRDELRAAVEPSRVKGLSDRLKAAAADFESSHPRLNAAVERVIDTLAFYNL